MTPTLSPDIIEYLRRKRFQDINSEAPSVDATPDIKPVAPVSDALDNVVKPIAPSPAALSPMLANTGPTPFKPQAPVAPIAPQPMIEQAPDIKTEAPLIPSVVQPLAERPRDLAERPVEPYQPPFQTERHQLFHDVGTKKPSDFEPRKGFWKKAGALAAGIGTGILDRNPYAGMEMYQRIRNPRYYDYMQQRAIEHEDIAKADEIAQAQEEARQAGLLNQAKMAQEYGTAQWREAQAMNEYNPIEHPQTLGQVQSIAQARSAGTEAGKPGTVSDPYEIEFTKADGTTGKLTANQNSKTGAWSSGGQPIDPEVVKNLQRVRKIGTATDPNTPYEVSLASFRATHGGRDPQTPQENQEVIANSLTAEQKEAAKVDLQLKRARISKLYQDIQNDRDVDSASGELADIVHENSGFVESLSGKPLVSTVLAMKKKGYPIPGKLTAALKQDATNATTVKNMLSDLEAVIERNKGRRLGVIMGRVGQLEKGIGAEIIPWGSEQEKADSQTIRTLISSLVAREARMLGGGRAAVKVIDMIKDMAGKTSDSKAIMQGAFEGIRKSADATLNAVEERQFGTQKTGKEDNKPRTAQGGYKVGGIYGNLVYLGGDPNDSGSWRPK